MSNKANFRAGNPASTPEVRPIDLRGADGSLVRMATEAEAELMVSKGLGHWRGSWEVRLDAGATHHGAPRTWTGAVRPGRLRTSEFGHNYRVCEGWNKK